jgi:hypothetical protein
MNQSTLTRKWSYLGVLAMALEICLLIPAHAVGQMETTTGIAGNVKDASGAVIPGANVTVREQNTGALHQTKTGVVPWAETNS